MFIFIIICLFILTIDFKDNNIVRNQSKMNTSGGLLVNE